MTGFFIGLSLGLLLHRKGHKPLLQFPIRCWFLGHRYDPQRSMCKTCRGYMEDEDDKWNRTFWTE